MYVAGCPGLSTPRRTGLDTGCEITLPRRLTARCSDWRDVRLGARPSVLPPWCCPCFPGKGCGYCGTTGVLIRLAHQALQGTSSRRAGRASSVDATQQQVIAPGFPALTAASLFGAFVIGAAHAPASSLPGGLRVRRTVRASQAEGGNATRGALPMSCERAVLLAARWY